jgi:long-chain fatty acid transport protein
MAKSFQIRLLALTCATSALALSAGGTKAEYIQSLGMSDRAIALGGAVVSDSKDFDAFYTNPAGAANFATPFIGAGVRILDTTNLKFNDATGSNPPDNSIQGSQFAYAPAAGGYLPLNLGGNKLVVGLGFGAPFAIVGDWAKDKGNHRFNMASQELFSIDLSPTVAWKISDTFSVGASVNLQAFSFLRLQSIVNLGGFGGLTGKTNDTLTLQTRDRFPLPVPPWEFDTGFETVGVTLGAQYRPLPGVQLGVSFRSKQENTFEGKTVLRSGGAIIGQTNFSADVDLPGHLQFGGSFDLIPQTLRAFVDVQWTMWSDTAAFGKASVIKTPGLVPGVLNGLAVDYKADDTYSIRVGAEYTPASMPGWAFRTGYWYDPSPFPNNTVDILTYSSDRHIFSAGVGLDHRNASGSGFKYDISGQFISYESRKRDNLPGLTPGTTIGAGGIASFDQATGNTFNYGGHIASVGLSVSYGF